MIKRFFPTILIIFLFLASEVVVNANDTALVGKWRIESVQVSEHKEKSWTALPDVYLTLEFKPDGSIVEEGSCNKLEGSYKLSENSKISILFGGTKIGCSGEPDFWMLNSAQSYDVTNGQLLINFGNNDYKGKFFLTRTVRE